ncbi:MAG: large conductance mechanosensitive channel protein MscL [Clostridia bacterium]|nr:large conductance mechanosensitive channel protein MscL [Clostridia bacterium]
MAKKKSTFWKDFKAFITRGNVVDMAVGVVVGGSFSKIVTGLVNNIINPAVNIFMKKGGLDAIKTVITPAVLDESGAVVTAEVAILWGTWLQTILDFLITAFCVFLLVRIITGIRKKFEAKKLAEEAAKAEEAKAKAEAEKAAAAEAAKLAAEKQAALDASILEQAKLLAEIRDLMKNK